MYIRSIFFSILTIIISLFSLVAAQEPASKICDEGLVLVVKDSISEVACFTPETANAIVERGWGNIVQESSPISTTQDDNPAENLAPIYVPSNEGNQVSMLDSGHITVKVPSSEVGGQFVILEDFVQPGFGPPRHFHYYQTEVFHFLEGDFEVLLGDELLQVSTGDIVVIPPGTIHTFSNVGDTPGRFFSMVLPGDNYEDFFYKFSESLQAGDRPIIEVINELSNEYNQKPVGPPLNK